MFARNVRWAVALLFAFAVCTSCSQQDELAGEAASGEEIVTTVGVSVPELFKTRTGTRADADVYSVVYGDDATRYLGTSGKPSVGNVDLTAHNLNYTVGVYVKKRKQNEGDPDEYALVGRQFHKAEDDNAYFEFRLLKGQKYRLVAYADFKGEKADLTTISYTTALNDELSDAFFASEDFLATENVQVVLKRPFGKLRLVAHDFNAVLAAGGAFRINKVMKVTYKGAPTHMLATNTFDALNGKFISKEPAEGETVEGGYNKDTKDNYPVEVAPVVYTEEYTAEGKAPVDENGKEGPVAVFTMYLPANHVDESDTPESYMYPFDVAVQYENADGGTTTIERSFTIDIPVKRNHLTTVDVEHFWTGPSGVMVTVDAAFDGEIKAEEEKPETVKTAAELQNKINEICKNAPIGETTVRKIVLGADINMGDLSKGVVKFDAYSVGPDPTITTKNDVNRTVEIYLDLNNYKIYSEKENPNVYNSTGLISIESRNTILHIDDTSTEAKGGIEYRRPYPGTGFSGYPLISCVYGGQVVINRGNFKSTSTGPLVWVSESENQRALTQIEVLKALWGTPENCPQEKPDFEAEENAELKKKGETVLKKLTSTATINGGWFENVTESSFIINAYNVREYTKEEEGKKTGAWAKYHDYAKRNGYPEWTDWGEYHNQIFCFVHVNGGSFVEFDPSGGDNIVGNRPEPWVSDSHHVQTETVNRGTEEEPDYRTVYTVIPQDEVHPF